MTGPERRAAYLGPAGTFSEEALRAYPGAGSYAPEPVGSVRDVVLAVHDGRAARGIAPIENALEGSVNATLDALAFEAGDVRIAGELVLPVRHLLLGHPRSALEHIRTVVSHPQATAQCARWLREHLPGATLLAGASTAEAARAVAAGDVPSVAAIGTALAAELYGCRVLAAGIEDADDNTTRFVWLAPAGEVEAATGAHGPCRSSVVFWGAGSGAAGWLVRCLSEFAFRGVNLTRIESRPLRTVRGEYAFFADLDGAAGDAPVAEAIDALGRHATTVKVLGSYPLATPGRQGAPVA